MNILDFACEKTHIQQTLLWQADQSQPWLRLFKVTKLHLDVVRWVWAPMLNSLFFAVRCLFSTMVWRISLLLMELEQIQRELDGSRMLLVLETTRHVMLSYSSFEFVDRGYWTRLLVSDRVVFGLDRFHSLLFLLLFLGLDVLSCVFNNLIPHFTILPRFHVRFVSWHNPCFHRFNWQSFHCLVQVGLPHAC